MTSRNLPGLLPLSPTPATARTQFFVEPLTHRHTERLRLATAGESTAVHRYRIMYNAVVYGGEGQPYVSRARREAGYRISYSTCIQYSRIIRIYQIYSTCFSHVSYNASNVARTVYSLRISQ